MVRGLRSRFLVSLFLLAATPGTGIGQGPEEEPNFEDSEGFDAEEPGGASFYTLDSHPVPSQMSLRGGPTRLEGSSPFKVPGDVFGSFTIDVRAPGYESQRGRVRFPGAGAPLEVGAFPESGGKDVLVSVSFPGIAQLVRAEEPIRGIGLFAAGVAGLGGVAGAELRRRDAETEAHRNHLLAAEAANTEARTMLELEAARQAATADRARTARRDWTLVSLGVWGLSAIDTYLLGPSLDGTQDGLTDLTLNLRPLSRTQAALRSIVPGFGQFYAGRKGAGALASFGGLAAGVALIVAEHGYEESVHRMAAVQSLYDDPLADPETLALLAPALEEQARKADDARVRRNTTGAIAAGVWVANLLDALLMTPTPVESHEPSGARADHPELRFGVMLGEDAGGESLPRPAAGVRIQLQF